MFKKILSVFVIILVAMCSFMAVLGPTDAQAVPGVSVSVQTLVPYTITWGEYGFSQALAYHTTTTALDMTPRSIYNGTVIFIQLHGADVNQNPKDVFLVRKGDNTYTITLPYPITSGYWMIIWDPSQGPNGPIWIIPVSGPNSPLPPLENPYPADPNSPD